MSGFWDISYSDFKERWDLARLRAHESRLILRRSLAGANAGGAIASLSIIGTLIATSTNHKFPPEIFWVLCVFLFGLFFSLIESAFEYKTRSESFRWYSNMQGKAAEANMEYSGAETDQ